MQLIHHGLHEDGQAENFFGFFVVIYCVNAVVSKKTMKMVGSYLNQMFGMGNGLGYNSFGNQSLGACLEAVL